MNKLITKLFRVEGYDANHWYEQHNLRCNVIAEQMVEIDQLRAELAKLHEQLATAHIILGESQSEKLYEVEPAAIQRLRRYCNGKFHYTELNELQHDIIVACVFAKEWERRYNASDEERQQFIEHTNKAKECFTKAEAALAQAYADLRGCAEVFRSLANEADSPNRENLIGAAKAAQKQADRARASTPLTSTSDLTAAIAICRGYTGDYGRNIELADAIKVLMDEYDYETEQTSTVKILREELVNCKTNEVLESNRRSGMTTDITKCRAEAQQMVDKIGQ